MSRSNGREGSLRACIHRKPRISTTLLALAIASSVPTVPYASSISRALAESSARRVLPLGLAAQQANSTSLRASYAQLPLSFEANYGQVNRQVKFLVHGPGSTVFLTPTSVVLALSASSRNQRGADIRAAPGFLPQPALGLPRTTGSPRQAVVRLRFARANPHPTIVGLDELPGKVNYFIGNNPHRWHTNIPTYARVEYKNVYPGINLVYYGRQGHLEYDWVVRPGADPAQIKLNVDGTRHLRVDGHGNLVLQSAVGPVLQARPVIYQQIAGIRRVIAGGYLVTGEQVGFRVGVYSASKPLVIDPSLIYSTYLGGSFGDSGNGIAVDSAGNAYVTGATSSLDFPTKNALKPTNAGSSDIFITEIGASGSSLVYSTYLGGSADDFGNGIAVDSAGNAYVTGWTDSGDFPTKNPIQPTYGGSIYSPGDAFVAEVGASGSSLVYSTYLGGSFGDSGNGIAVDSAGNAYITGETSSLDFPIKNAIQPMCGGGPGACTYGSPNAFITEIAASGTSLVYSTYLGGGDFQYGSGPYGTAIAVDSAGNAYITGSTTPGFPTKNAIQPTYGGGDRDAFVAEIAASGTSLVYSTYLGGAGSGQSGDDGGNGIAVDSAGNAYITGDTYSASFPTKNAIQSTERGYYNAFITEIAASDSSLVYSTYLGGSAEDIGAGIAVDSGGNAYVTGFTASGDFPVCGTNPKCASPNSAIQSTNGGYVDAFITEIAASGNALVYSTYLGGIGGDKGNGIALDGAGDAYVAGYTGSTDFPICPDNGGTHTYCASHSGTPVQATIAGGTDAFVAKISPGASSGPIGGPIHPQEMDATGSPSEPCLWCMIKGAARAVVRGGEGMLFVKPINAETGNFTHTFTDFAIPGRGIALNLSHTYNSDLASANGPLGYGWVFNYGMSLGQDANTGKVTIYEEGGSQITFTVSNGVYSAPPRVVATLVKSGDGSFTFTRQARMTYAFNAAGQLTKEQDLNGYAMTFSYNGSNQLATVMDSANRSLTLGYTGTHLTSVTDPLNRKVLFAYNDGQGNLTDVTDVNGGVTHFTYDANHRMLTMTDPRGVVTQNVYDTQGRVTQQTTDPTGLNRITTFAYSGDPFSSAGGSTTITDPKGNATVQTYQYGELLSTTKGYGTSQAATWAFTYDPATLGVTSTTDPDNNVTMMKYDASGNLLKKTDALGRETDYTYNSFNEPLTVTDPCGNLTAAPYCNGETTADMSGHTTTNMYDANGNLLSTSTPLAGTSQVQLTTNHYDDPTHPGDVTSVTDPENKTTRYTYDAYGNRISTTDPLGDQTTSTYNVVGWLLTTVSPKGNVAGCGCTATYTTKYSYVIPGTTTTDQFGDVQTITDPLGHVATYGYDADRNKTSVKDADGNLTTYVYDAANEMTQVKRADGTTTTTDYYPDGTVLDQKDGKGNAIQTYGYDALARVMTVKDALGNTTTYSYDPAGNQLTKQDPGGNCAALPKSGCTSSTYDAANQLISVSYSDGITPNVTSISYDVDGQRTSLTDGTGNWVWNYDSLHRLASVTEGNNGTVAYTYNLRDLLTSINYPGTAVHVVTRGYDDAGRLISVQDWLGNLTQFRYDANSNLVATLLPFETGVIDNSAYNAADQLMSISDNKGTTALFSATYTRDSNSQFTSDSSANGNQHSYKYTPLNQVCYAGATTTFPCSKAPPGFKLFGYDAADNLVRLGTTTQSFNAADELCWTLNGAGSNACGSAPGGAKTYTYDTRGNRLTIAPGTQTFVYDQANRLTKYVNGSTTASYIYSADGLRMIRTVGTVTSQEAWEVSGGLPLLLADGTTSYVYGPGGLALEQIAGTSVNWYHHDQLGSTRAITDSTGALMATYTYDSYGSLAASTGTLTNPFRFSGEYQDGESGLYYLRARYYDPATAQFLTRDAMVAATMSPYAYVSGDPLNASDPSGECGPLCVVAVIAAISWVLYETANAPTCNANPDYGAPDCQGGWDNLHQNYSSNPPGQQHANGYDATKGTASCSSGDDCYYTFPGGPAPRTIYVPHRQVLTTGINGQPTDCSYNPLYGYPSTRTWLGGATGGEYWYDPAQVLGNQNYVWTPSASGPDTQAP